MLQSNQLQQLALRRPNEIAELQTFFRNASLPLNTADSLPTLASRVQQERSFRRDLISHLWVISHNDTPPIAVPELLGLLTIAVAGAERAANASDADAHALLRFLMEARRTFEGPTAAPQPVPIRPAAPVVPVAAVEPPAPLEAPFLLNRRPTIDSSPYTSFETEEEPADHRPLIGLIVAACLVIALSLVLWLRHPSTPQQAGNDAAATQPAATIVTPEAFSANPPAAVAADTHTAPASHRSEVNRSISSDLRPQHKPTPLVAGNAAPPAATSRPAARATNHATPGYAEAAPVAPPSRHALIRRAPATAAPTPAASEPRVPNVQPVDLGTEAEDAASVPSSSRPVVRPVSLGIMAANVTYSPAPTYPPAASAAHVQGEVKVEAEVGTDGNVTSARVISGPPLLREAAVSAVERWRYRPYMAEGKPITMSALIVMDFQLH